MSISAIVIVLLLLVIAFVLLAIGLGLPITGEGFAKKAAVQTSVKNMVAVQRTASQTNRTAGSRASIVEAANATKVKRLASSKLTLEKKLRYARWPVPPILFRTLQILLSVLFLIIANLKLNFVMQGIAIIFGPIMMNYLLNRSLMRRFLVFDADYVPFLMSLVGLLKTGMNPMNALASAAEGLEQGSLVKSEVHLMLERLRMGVSEEQSIGAFGEDVAHPEIELFIEALLLSRRVGGNLSETLERLARQIRSRQYFRQGAHAAVGLQRASIGVIILVLLFVEGYLYIMAPQLINGAFANPTAFQVWQGGLFLIVMGVYFVRQVTKIKI